MKTFFGGLYAYKHMQENGFRDTICICEENLCEHVAFLNLVGLVIPVSSNPSLNLLSKEY
jgi:hypothetical protein